jgi:hypothetical protein
MVVYREEDAAGAAVLRGILFAPHGDHMGFTQTEVINDALDGPKSEFRKLSVTVPHVYYEKLIAESARRKICGEPKQLLSSLLREALSEYIGKLSG